jgi:hypothetical protein
MQDETPAAPEPNESPASPARPLEVAATRRRFLKNAAVLGGLGLFGSCASAERMRKTFGGISKHHEPASRGKSFTPIAADEPVRIGVIGTGGMGTGHCHSIANLAKSEAENVQILAVSDLALPRMDDAAKALEAKQGFGVAQYQDYRELLAREDLHGVLIATPEHWHADCAIDAIMAG